MYYQARRVELSATVGARDQFHFLRFSKSINDLVFVLAVSRGDSTSVPEAELFSKWIICIERVILPPTELSS